MKRDGSARADEILRLVRGSSDPLPGEEQAMWALLQRRLGMPAVPVVREAVAPPPRVRA